MKWFFNNSYMMYAGVNEKGRRVQEYVEKMVYNLLDDKSLKAFLNDLREYNNKLNEERKNSLPFKVEETRSINSCGLDSVRIDVLSTNREQSTILWIHFVEVREIKRYEEKLNFTEE